MTTTSLFAELLIIGVGAFTAVCLTIASLTGIPALKLDDITALVFAFPFLAVSYVSGIVVDRAADFVFSWFPRIGVRQHRFPSVTDYHQAKRRIRLYATALARNLDYTRSRLRICRGWTLNVALLIVGSNLWIWLANEKQSIDWKVTCTSVFSALLACLGLGCVYSYITLNQKYRLQVYEKYRLLEEAKECRPLPEPESEDVL